MKIVYHIKNRFSRPKHVNNIHLHTIILFQKSMHYKRNEIMILHFYILNQY